MYIVDLEKFLTYIVKVGGFEYKKKTQDKQIKFDK